MLADWFVTYKIVDHIFGPNLHNELVKQSQVILNFLGMEGKITRDHIDIIWMAAMVCANDLICTVMHFTFCIFILHFTK